MNIRSLLFILILFALYLGCYYLTQNSVISVPAQESEMPKAFLPICKNQDIPLGINSEGYTYCQRDSSVHLLLPEKEVTVLDEKELDSYTIQALVDQQLVVSKDNLLRIYLLESPKAQLVNTYTLAKNEILVSVFGRKQETVHTLYFSTVLEVQSPKDIKSKIYKVTFANIRESSKMEPIYSSLQMEKVHFVYPGTKAQKETIFTIESYPFLQSLANVIVDGKKLTSCPIMEFGKSIVHPYLKTSTCNNKPEGWYSLENKDLLSTNFTQTEYDLLKTEKGNLRKLPNNQVEWVISEKKLQLQVPQEIWEKSSRAFFLESTNIGKRVYNCIDFGESAEITLRLCIPNL